MFNNIRYNQSGFNTGEGVVSLSASTSSKASIDGYPLETADGVLTIKNIFGHETSLAKDIINFSNPQSNGMTFERAFHRNRTLAIEIEMVETSDSNLTNKIIDFKKNVDKEQAQLRITQDGRTFDYLVDCTNIAIQRIKFPRYRVNFTCTFDVYKKEDTGKFSETFEGVTSSPYTFIASNNGVYETYLGVFVSVNSASSITEFTLENTDSGETCTLTQAINAGDTIFFDGESVEVKVNNASVDFDGRLPTIGQGASSTIVLTTTSTSHNLDVVYFTKFRY